jgi:ribosomal protein S27AE
MWDDKRNERIIDIDKEKTYEYKKELMKNLKPCPFCGLKWTEYPPELSVERWKLKPDTYRIICPRCGAASPDAYRIEWAVEKWNNRFGEGDTDDIL